MLPEGYTEKDITKAWCMSSLLNFTRYFFKVRFKRKFVVGEHHELIAAALDDVYAGKIKRLIINIAPRYGKTELAVKNFIAKGFAINPRAKFIHLSYSDDLALDNSSDIQDILSTSEFKELFEARASSRNAKKWYTEQGGGLYAVSSAGQVTGFGAGLVDKDTSETEDAVDALNRVTDASQEFGGAIIIDDPIKPDDALSPQVRDKVNQKFETTIRNRVNSRNTPIIIIMQRLNENDLCGYLEKLEPDAWTVLSLPCLTVRDGEEHALWEFKHTVAELHELRAKSEWVFDTQYQQNPKPLEGLMYEGAFKTYDEIPATRVAIRKNYTDTADTGEDYHCSIDYIETEIGNYVLDVLFTQKPMEYTEPAQAKMMSRDNIAICLVESNNGGRGFARNVETQLRLMNNTRTKVRWFHQANNKDSRIFTHSAEVQNLIYFPRGWDQMFPEFYSQVTGYMKVGSNPHDDGPDALTGTVEFRPNGKKNSAAGYFD